MGGSKDVPCVRNKPQLNPYSSQTDRVTKERGPAGSSLFRYSASTRHQDMASAGGGTQTAVEDTPTEVLRNTGVGAFEFGSFTPLGPSTPPNLLGTSVMGWVVCVCVCVCVPICAYSKGCKN